MMVKTLARRATLGRIVAAIGLVGARDVLGHHDKTVPAQRFYRAADAQRKLAQSWGDQAYGAVLVIDGKIVGEGPSRVVQRGDSSAHAEREAIRDAQRKLARTHLPHSVLYSTSRPCTRCEHAAAAAGVARMIYGEALYDAGKPKG
ncbi:MAG TPA: deaminase [Casimicrobiaceae bacterium]|nr:deaminase [Casimicrobiaceae bacterium]